MAKYTQGPFKPKNPQKYIGDPTNIVFRSSWELKLMLEFDKNPNVLEWRSEEDIIWYRCPTDNRMHRYFPDFRIKKRNASDGRIVTVLIEVKPKKQTVPPTVQATKKNKPTKRYLNEVMTWGKNSAKWAAAREYCADRGWEFSIITEDDL